MTRPLYKILGPARDAIHGGTGVWPEPGEWLEVDGPIQPCRHGLHLCRQQDLIRWARVGAVVWTVETTGPVVDDGIKVVVGRARLVGPVGRITERVLRLTAADIAESVAHLHGRDPGCMGAIRVARLCAHGLATAGEAEAARSAAWEAARAASEEASRESAREAAEEGSLEAARAAAAAATWAAARWDTREAAEEAARDVSWKAAWAAARWDTREAAEEAARDVSWKAARAAARWDTREAAREAALVGHGGSLLNNLIRWGQQ